MSEFIRRFFRPRKLGILFLLTSLLGQTLVTGCHQSSEKAKFRASASTELIELLSFILSAGPEKIADTGLVGRSVEAEVLLRELKFSEDLAKEAFSRSMDPNGVPYLVIAFEESVRGWSVGENGVDEKGHGDDVVKVLSRK